MASSHPISSASSATTSRPVRIRSSARLRPTTCGSRAVPPAPGRMPINTSGWPITVRGEPTRTSSARRNSAPPPRATPSIAPIVSRRPADSRWNVVAATLATVAGSYGARREARIPSTSPCIRKKSGSALWNTATFTPSSASSSSSVASRATMNAPSTRLVGGWSIVTTATPASCATARRSVTNGHSSCARGRGRERLELALDRRAGGRVEDLRDPDRVRLARAGRAPTRRRPSNPSR